MDTSTPQQLVQGLYLSLLGRAADPAGLHYWVDELANSSLDVLSERFVNSREFQDNFGDKTPEEFVRLQYYNLFDRNPDKAGLDFWTAQLETGALDRDDLPGAILDGASESDQEAYRAKLSIADYYTSQVPQERYDPEQPLTYPWLHSNAELYADLNRLDERYDTLDLEQVGASLKGNPLYRAEVGHGDKTVMIVTQQHGDEPLGTEASLYLLDFLAGDSEAAREIREEVTVVVMPRVNPDGFARWERQVGGEQDVLDPRRNEANVDLNRSYDPEAGFDPEQAPEAAAVFRVLEEYQPDLLLDYHNQNNYRDAEGDLDTMSVRWATNEAVAPQVSADGQRAALAIAEALEDYDHDQLTLFPGSDNPAIARNGLALEGTPTLLIEQRGLQEMDELAQGLDLDYSALASALTLEGLISMKGVIGAVADDSFEDYDPQLAARIPERSERIQFADLYGDDAYTTPETSPTMPAEEAALVGVATAQEDLIA